MKYLITLLLILITINIDAEVLSKEYYEKRNLLERSDDNRSYDGGSQKNWERDKKIVVELLNYIKDIPFNNNKEILRERYFIISAINSLFPLTEYNRDYTEALVDDYQKCLEPKRSYYLIYKKWIKEQAIFSMINDGLSKEISERILTALWKLKNQNSDIKKNGKKECEALFNEKQFNMGFLRSYVEGLNEIKDYQAVTNFYVKYADQINDKEYVNQLSVLYLSAVSSAYKSLGKKEQAIKVIDKFVNKMDKLSADSRNVERIKQYPDWIKNEYSRVLLSNDVTADVKRKNKIDHFFKKTDLYQKRQEKNK